MCSYDGGRGQVNSKQIKIQLKMFLRINIMNFEEGIVRNNTYRKLNITIE